MSLAIRRKSFPVASRWFVAGMIRIPWNHVVQPVNWKRVLAETVNHVLFHSFTRELLSTALVTRQCQLCTAKGTLGKRNRRWTLIEYRDVTLGSWFEFGIEILGGGLNVCEIHCSFLLLKIYFTLYSWQITSREYILWCTDMVRIQT